MSLRDKANEIAEKARRYAIEHKSKIDEGIEKMETLVDKRIGGQYHDRIATATGKAKNYIKKLPQTNLEREARSMTAEPSVNDLTPMLAPGVENEPMLLLDTTGSMSYPVAEDSKVQRRQVIGEAIGRIVEVMGAKDSQAAKEQAKGEDAGGLMTVTFAGGSAECIDDLSPANWRQKWNAIRWGGGTQIMPGWEALVDTYMTEFSNLPKQDRPHLLALVITDGEAEDTAQFAKSLEQTKGGTYVCIAVLGFGQEHDAALTAYQHVAASNDHVRVVTFGSETDPTVIANGVLSLIGS
ncbi:MAG: Rv0909 family putative TA system antitoxin [Pseudonocardiaceae bacterium]